MVLTQKQKYSSMEWIESSEINPHVCGHLIYDREASIHNGGKDKSLQEVVLNKLAILLLHVKELAILLLDVKKWN